VQKSLWNREWGINRDLRLITAANKFAQAIEGLTWIVQFLHAN
jgi:hypothetical protein